MKRLYKAMLIAGLTLAFSAPDSAAQDDLSIFGYFQSTFVHSVPDDSTVGKKNNSFNVQQLNVFLSKNLSDDFSAFVNLELTNSFSSERNWGALNLEEAWVKYAGSDAFNIKGGLLIPQFNNLNEIKNKTPLLPYILRPLVYEASISSLINLENYVPQRAFVQVYGAIPLADAAKFHYAVYAGNSDRVHINGGTGQRGVDTTTYKLVGGRVGITYDNLKLGVSSTYDRENPAAALGLVEVPRTRVGADLSYSIAGFTLEGEMIMVRYSLTDAEQARLDSVATHPILQYTYAPSLDKTFYYANLSYNISSDLYVYGGYSYMDDKSSRFWEGGFTSVTGGVGYRPIDEIVLKAQYGRFDGGYERAKYKQSSYYFAASVFF